jgi:hypothetical protein
METRWPKAAVVVIDWKTCYRANLWKEEFKNLNRDLIDCDKCVEVCLVDSPALLYELETRQILIFNFDSINGDPAFGSDFALRWLQIHHLRLLRWVEQGGTLIIDGQTRQSIPTQESYDALFGHRELAVSGLGDGAPFGRAALDQSRTGDSCKVTAKAFSLFNGLDSIRMQTPLAVETLFPGSARFVIYDNADEPKAVAPLFRGWFTRIPVLTQRLNWMPLVETAYSHVSNHPVLMGARVKKGAVFLSTMILAGTGQARLIEQLIRLGDQHSAFRAVESSPMKMLHWIVEPKKLVSIVASVIAGAGLLISSRLVKPLVFQLVTWTTLVVAWFTLRWWATKVWRSARDFWWD